MFDLLTNTKKTLCVMFRAKTSKYEKNKCYHRFVFIGDSKTATCQNECGMVGYIKTAKIGEKIT